MSHDVVVVGAGPVGLMLAAELRAAGCGALVLERAPRPDPRLRAPAITERTIEALERHRLLDPLVAATARQRAQLGAREDTLPADLRVDGTRALPIRQDLVEELLEEHVLSLGGDVRRGHEVVGLRQRPDHVDLRVRCGDGPPQLVRARFAVGCDGGHSAVRQAAGIAFPSGGEATLTGYQAEVRVADPSVLRRGWQRTPTGIASYELCPSRVVSIEFGGPAVPRGAPVTLAEVQASLRRTSGTEVTLTEPRSLTRFTDNARLAEAYRRGRVLLAGDAAHVHAPFGGQGLNLGMQDAVNLGWKLAAAVRGGAPARLLDSYEQERRPVAEEVLRNVRAATALLNPDERMTPLHDLFAELRGIEEVRRHMHRKTAMVDLRYPTQAAHPLPGRAPVGLRVQTGGGALDVSRVARAGRGLVLDLSRAGCAAGRVAAAGDHRVDAVTAPAAPAPEGVDAADADGLAALLLRPDGHVAWVQDTDGREHPAPLRDVLARTFGPPADHPQSRGKEGPDDRHRAPRSPARGRLRPRPRPAERGGGASVSPRAARALPDV